MSLDLNNVSTKSQLDWPANNRIYCRVFVFSLSRVFVFQLFKILGNTGMVAKATKFIGIYLEDEA